MPWEIIKENGGYYVVNKLTKKKKNKEPYPTRAAAEPYLKALYSNTASELLTKHE